VSVAVPLAATEKLAAFPEITELELGCVVIVGAVAAAVTVSVAALLVAEPALLVTTTV
jgi:hypothetical protein